MISQSKSFIVRDCACCSDQPTVPPDCPACKGAGGFTRYHIADGPPATTPRAPEGLDREAVARQDSNHARCVRIAEMHAEGLSNEAAKHCAKSIAACILDPWYVVRDKNNEIIALRPTPTGDGDVAEALKPFAEAADDLDDKDTDRGHLWESPAAMSLTAGDLRRARAALAASKAQGGTETAAARVRHVKTGGKYEVLFPCAEIQAPEASPLTDYEVCVVYRSLTDGRVWVRRKTEFDDGRFVPAAPPPATNVGA